jgi:hypothetical protein
LLQMSYCSHILHRYHHTPSSSSLSTYPNNPLTFLFSLPSPHSSTDPRLIMSISSRPINLLPFTPFLSPVIEILRRIGGVINSPPSLPILVLSIDLRDVRLDCVLHESFLSFKLAAVRESCDLRCVIDRPLLCEFLVNDVQVMALLSETWLESELCESCCMIDLPLLIEFLVDA